jgi:hypothetical protein
MGQGQKPLNRSIEQRLSSRMQDTTLYEELGSRVRGNDGAWGRSPQIPFGGMTAMANTHP